MTGLAFTSQRLVFGVSRCSASEKQSVERYIAHF